ncbi:TetR family transcriptional regulator C-terminal domain-containing protein [Tenacibaculum sp. MEBiC06402]|uniref:TetR family transcriptional regulator C-terminal domain-containing protein n=1 Tax=unclassified Tenacibaculum TaxID=2635139 RepID=UPI003B99DD46
MAKKKNITKDFIIEKYMDYVLTYNENPKSIYLFSKNNNFVEQIFYEHFTSFESLQNSIFEIFHTNTLSLLVKSEDVETYNAQNKLLSYYYTIFEIFIANRSYVIYALKHQKDNLKKVKMLSGLKKHFQNFVHTLEIPKLDFKQDRIEKIQDKAIAESAWMQFVITLKFWLEDTSNSFEKTDVFIEKSVNASFELLNIAPVKSVIDLGKFLYKETIGK